VCITNGKVGGDVAPKMTFDGHARFVWLLDVFRYVGFDRFEDRWGRIVGDRDLETLARQSQVNLNSFSILDQHRQER
jgi:hypothetical protein